MSADFTPTFSGYTSMKPFRFWCQKVLPSVFDDSLSYYEVLCKLVSYLNTVIENLEAVEANTDALLEAYQQLQDWVNDYFDNLDVQDEIDDKIDRMVEDGTFDRWIEPIIEEYKDDLQSILNDYAEDASEYVQESEAWARGTKNGVDVDASADQYHNNSKYYAEQASDSADSAEQAANDASDSAEDSEAWARGTKGGTPVGSGEEQYENNAKYYAEQAAGAVVDVNAVKEFACANCFKVSVRGTITKSKSSITNFNNLGLDHAGMLEFTIPVDSATSGSWTQFGDFTRLSNSNGIHPVMIAAHCTYEGLAEQYQLICRDNSNISSMYDSSGDWHFFLYAWDFVNGNWAADGVAIDCEVVFTIVSTTSTGTAQNGTYA